MCLHVIDNLDEKIEKFFFFKLSHYKYNFITADRLQKMSFDNKKRSLETEVDADEEVEKLVTKRVKSITSDLLREFECAICYETMAATCCLSSCGCNFCFQCIKQWYDHSPKAECPCCKEHFVLEVAVANKRFDSIIRSFMTNGQVAKADVDAWETRVSKGIEEFNAFVNRRKRKPRIVQAIDAFAPQPHYLHNPRNQTTVPTTPPTAAAPTEPPLTREMMQVLIRTRASQVIAAASLPQNADNTVLQRRAVRAQIVINQINAQIDAQRIEDAVQYTATVLRFDE